MSHESFLKTRQKTIATWFVIDNFERKMHAGGSVRAGKVFTLFISNEDMDDIIRMIKSLENSDVSMNGITATVKHKIKNENLSFLLVC